MTYSLTTHPLGYHLSKNNTNYEKNCLDIDDFSCRKESLSARKNRQL